jgi:very-short-patch-repair endonuclease
VVNTLEQRDKKRDRALQTAGFEVHHFTGSEIWADPIECAREVLARAEQLATDKPTQPPG